MWGVILLFKPFFPLYLGSDNLNLLKFGCKLLHGAEWVKPLPLHRDGDLIAKIQGIWDERGRSTVKVVEVEGHTTEEEMVATGLVRRQD